LIREIERLAQEQGVSKEDAALLLDARCVSLTKSTLYNITKIIKAEQDERDNNNAVDKKK
jgi:uncharacterized protein (UPF0335 family)